MTWVWLLLVGCSDRPPRPDPTELPGRDDDELEVPIPNDCLTRVATFELGGTGYVEGEWEGIGLYEYRSPSKQTAFYLRECDGEAATGVAWAMHFYGVARIEPGSYPFDRLAEFNGGVTFAYTDEEAGVTCTDQPTGTLNISKADFWTVKGDFSVTVGCMSDELLGRIPRETVFTGTFKARNVGVE